MVNVVRETVESASRIIFCLARSKAGQKTGPAPPRLTFPRVSAKLSSFDYVKQKLIYVKADDFGSLPAIGRQIVFDGKRYMVTDSTDEGGVYTITMEANRTK